MKIDNKHFLTLLCILIGMVAMSQGPSTAGLDQYPDNSNGVPIDGGLSVLLAAGAGYGAKKIKDARNKARVRKN